MEMQIQTYIKRQKKPQLITVFGYSTKSIPGLEIIGLGKSGKNIKEKIIFITRSRKLLVPIKRFVLTCDDVEDIEKGDDIRHLEFPLLLLYWHLAQIIPPIKLSNCFVFGEICPAGTIQLKWNADLYSLLMNQHLILLSKNHQDGFENINPLELLENIPEIRWIEFPLNLNCLPSQNQTYLNNP